MDLSVPDASPPLFDFQANIKGVIFCCSWCVKLPLILTHKRSTSTETTLFPRQPHHKKTHFFSCPWGGRVPMRAGVHPSTGWTAHIFRDSYVN